MNLLALPAFTDNYIWMLHDDRQAVVVDPGDASAVLEVLQRQGLQLAAILVTHRHLDHVGGLAALRPHLNGPVYGTAHSSIDGVDIPVQEGDHIDIQGIHLDVWDTPGHTADHVSYLAHIEPGSGQPPLMFCGDTLFSAGCGRLFDGTAEQLFNSLSRIGALPDHTVVCCTHEYTLANLRFSREVEPGNQAIIEHERHCIVLRNQDLPTLPTRIGTERAINPFLRCREPEVIRSALRHGAVDDSPLEVFTALRLWKNNFSA